MTSEQSALDIMNKALWDPKPTTTDLQSQQLAVALGYPMGWRVVRSQEDDGCFVDRIYSGQPGSGCDTWFNHAGAMEAASTWEESDKSLYAYKGGHLLPMQPLFEKDDRVQVLYQDEWWDAKILRRKEYPGIFKYQVFYPSDSSRQGGVEEYLIRPRPAEIDPEVTAVSLGFVEGWKAYSIGSSKWKIVSPSGEVFKSKKAALEAMKAEAKAVEDEGDPPWRTSGNEYLGRQIKWVTQHKASARRTVTLEQIGTVTGWISETDVDKDGEPGFVSEKTGKPERLYHVKFEEDKHHKHANLLVSEQDVEEWELKSCLVEEEAGEEEKRPSKQQRT